MARIGNFDNHGVDHRKVQRRRHAVIKERGIHHLARVIKEILFVESPANALNRATLHLPFDIAGVDGLACILYRCETSDVGFTGIRVNSYVCEVHRISVAFASGVDVRSTRDSTASRS